MKKELNPFYRLYSGRKALTIQEKEAVLEAVLAQTLRPGQASLSSAYRRTALYRVALVLCALVAISIPAVYVVSRDESREEGFTAKGGDDAPLFTVRCTGMDNEHRCKLGETLVFQVSAPSGKSYFSAFGRNEKSDRIVWYYPADEGALSPEVGQSRRVLSDGIVLGEEHVPGAYVVFGIFTEVPVTRSEIRAQFDRGEDVEGDFGSVGKMRFEVY